MVSDLSTQSDKAVGFTVTLSLLALGAAVTMAVSPDQQTTAWAFAGAMVAAVFAVVASQVYV